MKIRNAELCDLPYLLEMLENAKASLRALGIDQWQNGYPNETTLREDIQNKICRVVIDDENNILASAAVYLGDEPTYHEIYNGAWQTENKIYGIVHRIMAANHAKKRGAASFLMTYCAKLSLEAGVTSMRYASRQHHHAAHARKERLHSLRHHSPYGRRRPLCLRKSFEITHNRHRPRRA